MQSSFTLFRVRGIPIGANWTWLAVAAYFVYSLSTEFSLTDPGHSSATYIAMGIVTVIAFFGSLILHELGHAFRALKEGMQIEGITLWLFGGVARFKGMFPSAGAEFRIAIAGPVVTAVISGVMYAATAGLQAAGIHGPVTAVFSYLAFINLILLVFNLIPALPLDGGRVYRSYVWYRRKNFTEATVQAARTSRGLSAAMIAIGVIGFLRGIPGLVWPGLIGFFIFQSAKGELAFAQFRQALGGLKIRDIMTPDPETIDIGTSIGVFVENILGARGHSTYPVTQFGRFVGLVSSRRAAEVPTFERSARRIRDVMIQRTDVPTASADDDVNDALAKLDDPSVRIVVLDGERIAGIVSPADIGRAIKLGQLRPAAGDPSPSTGSKRAGTIIPWIVVAVLLIGAGGYFVHPSVVVLSPGRSYNVSRDFTVSGHPTTALHGGFYLTSVSLTQPNVFQFLVALARGEDMTAIDNLVPKGVNQDQYFKDQLAEFKQSQQFAAAAAAEAAGLKVSITGSGAEVIQLTKNSPASKALQMNDVVVAVDGKPVHVTDDLGTYIRTHPVGTTLHLTVQRNGGTIPVDVKSANGLLGTVKAPAIGVVLSTKDLSVKLPFTIHFKKQDIGGPSAGFAYALAIYDTISPVDLAHGRQVAVTGTIDISGNVGPIGGIKQKTAAVEGAGAKWFVVPSSEAKDVPPTSLHIVGVDTLKQAIAQLRSSA